MEKKDIENIQKLYEDSKDFEKRIKIVDEVIESIGNIEKINALKTHDVFMQVEDRSSSTVAVHSGENFTRKSPGKQEPIRFWFNLNNELTKELVIMLKRIQAQYKNSLRDIQSELNKYELVKKG